MRNAWAADEARLLFAKPPAQGSKSYRELAAAAGDHSVEKLGMSGGEVWRLQLSAVDRVLATAKRLEVRLTRLDGDPAIALKGMTAQPVISRAEHALMSGAMNEPGAMASMMAELPAPAMMEYALIATDDAGAPKALRLSLASGLTVEAVRDRIEKSEGGYTWHGTIAGSDDPATLIWWPEGRLTGQVRYKNMAYQIRHFARKMHGVIAMSPAAMPPEHAAMPAGMMKKMNMSRDPLVQEGSAASVHTLMKSSNEKLREAQDAPQSSPNPNATLGSKETHTGPAASPAPAEITLLVAFTAKAAGKYSDIRRDLIRLAIEEANASFARSGVGHIKLRVVHSYQTRYIERGTHFEHLFRFADLGDGIMEEAHKKRDRYKADLSVLIVDDPKGCGLSAGIAPPADRAFAVVHHGCAAASYSLAHEIGHLLGARHDRALDDGGAPFPYGHGYVHNNEWRTMMAYEESCGKCPRLPVWSNPDLKVRGASAGNADTNNARVLAERAAVVSRYR